MAQGENVCTARRPRDWQGGDAAALLSSMEVMDGAANRERSNAAGPRRSF